MKKSNCIAIAIIVGITSFIIGHVTNCKAGKNHEPVTEVNYPVWHDSESFVTGELIYPDYANGDTLVIMNGPALNRIFADTANPYTMPTTDSEIDSVLNIYCRVK